MGELELLLSNGQALHISHVQQQHAQQDIQGSAPEVLHDGHAIGPLVARVLQPRQAMVGPQRSECVRRQQQLLHNLYSECPCDAHQAVQLRSRAGDRGKLDLPPQKPQRMGASDDQHRVG